MTELGIRYITTSRETDATDWLRKAATAGNGDAMIALAYLASRADNSEEANAWLTKATSANCDPLLLASFALLAKTTPPTDVTDDWLQIAASINEPKIAAALRRITNR